MSGDIQLRKRKGKGKKKAHLEALQREEYEQERLALKAMAYDTEDDVIDTKGKPMANNSGKSQSTSNGDSSGIVAKIIFLMLLVSLSVVVALILVELRAGLNDTVLETDDETKEEEPAAPEIPTPNIHMDEEVIPEAPSPIPVLQHDIEEEYEPLEATPPLEEYLHVKEVIVEVPPQAEKPILRDVVPEVSNGYDKLELEGGGDAHVVEVRESIPAEEAVKAAKIAEEVKVAASSEEALKVEIEESAPIVEDVEIISVKEPVKDEEIEGAFVEVDEDVPIEVDAQVEEIENVKPIKENLPMEKVEEVTSVEESPPVEKVEKKPIEDDNEELAVSKDNEGEDIVSEEAEVEDIITEKEAEGEDFVTVDESKEFDVRVEVAETAAPAEETLKDTESVEVEEELSIAKKVETLGAPAGLQESDEVPLEIKHEDDHKEEAQGHGKKGDDDDAPDDTDYDDDDEDDDDEDDDDEDDMEKVKSKILGQEETEEDEEDWSQYGKDGGVRLLTDAYLRVESLAEDVLEKDPNNAMVAQLAPHLSGVLRAMEAGQTDGLLDTLRHIQVILEDIKSRIESGEDSSEPLKETIEDARQPVYEKADITSEIDHNLREELDAAEKFINQNPGEALNSFGAILLRNPKSARAMYGRAWSLDRLAEVERSNTKLEQAIVTYRGVLDLADEEPSWVPLPLLRMAAERCIDRLIFRGFFGKAVRVQQRLLQRFPDDLQLRNKMGVTYLLMNQGSAAKEIYEAVLQKWPDDGFAQVHYGFILKTVDNNNTGAAYYMQKGIESGAEGTSDGRFYFHLGDALQREGKTKEAYEIYDLAVERGLFLSRYQRSLYNVDRLASRPFWTLEQTTYQMFFRKLEENWEAIRDEGIELLSLPSPDGFRSESENLREVGEWKQYELFSRGRKITANCVKAPKTCSLIENFPAAAGCKRGQVKFSVMYPNTHVHAHTGPTNCRLRAHLGLVIPDGLQMRVATEMASWQEGKVFVFDDSWEHEVWHDGSSYRLILIVDVWHPELTEHERKTLVAI